MVKKANLVDQYLEAIGGSIFEEPEYAKIFSDHIQGKHGIYALYSGGDLYYVGLAKDLKGRLKAHLRDRHKGLWNRYSVYLIRNVKYLKELETLIQRIFNPDGNIQKGKFPGAEDLNKKVARKVDEILEKERKKKRDRILGQLEGKSGRKSSKKVTARKRKKSGELKSLIGKKLKATYKGKDYTATVDSDGLVKFRNKRLSSSLAGVEITGYAVNGWKFWRYEKTPGNWVFIDELRG